MAEPVTTGTIDGRRAPSRMAVLLAAGHALQFPDWYGANLDALHDALNDLSWLPPGEVELIWTHPEAFRIADPEGYQAVLDIIRAAEKASEHGERPLRLRMIARPPGPR
jgi:RNAse (barnase) inhibitor barstar